MEAAAGYPAGLVSAAAPCPDCGALAVIAFEPRALRVSFTCPAHSGHSSLRLGGDDQEPQAAWCYGEREYAALALVAPVLAGDDDTWCRAYGSRAADYRARSQPCRRLPRAVKALAAFDAEHPQPMRLTPDVRCGDCGNQVVPYPPIEFGHGKRQEATPLGSW